MSRKEWKTIIFMFFSSSYSLSALSAKSKKKKASDEIIRISLLYHQEAGKVPKQRCSRKSANQF